MFSYLFCSIIKLIYKIKNNYIKNINYSILFIGFNNKIKN